MDEKKRQYNQEYYQRNREKACRASKKWREENPSRMWSREKNNAYMRVWSKTKKGQLHAEMAIERNRAKASKWPVGTFKPACRKQQGKCFICGDLKLLVADHDYLTDKPRKPICKA